MNYTEKYFELKKRVKFNGNQLAIDDAIDIITLPFNSEIKYQRIFTEPLNNSHEMFSLGMPDSSFIENNRFSYPVFLPKGKTKYSKAIILMHGLNERSWDKYLTWAYFLTFYTHRPVILFPLSFHMNRAPLEWSDPKLMVPMVDKRKLIGSTDHLSFVNVALSSRLSDDPMRFMRSGYQSAADLVKLSDQMEQGFIPFVEKGTRPDFFAYSIGAFVSQILLLANPNGMFSDSRFFLFCGGALFKDMNGISKLIMDKVAFEKLITFYTDEMDYAVQEKGLLSEFFSEDLLGKAFYSMIKEENNKQYREEKFTDATNNIYTISLGKDKVIPAWGINAALCFTDKRKKMVEMLDFPYEYNHENPFPVIGKGDHNVVDACFTDVFSKASDFLN
jgi:pimeloyl-ACP methyl ester carboxylesterase